jgi:hypothetical protein
MQLHVDCMAFKAFKKLLKQKFEAVKLAASYVFLET